MLQLFLLGMALICLFFGMFRAFFVVAALMVLYCEFGVNWDVAKVFRRLEKKERLAPTARARLREGILREIAEASVDIANTKRLMVVFVTPLYLALLAGMAYRHLFSWECFASLVLTLGHFFLLWVASNHKKKIKMYIEGLPPEDQMAVARLARLRRVRQEVS